MVNKRTWRAYLLWHQLKHNLYMYPAKVNSFLKISDKYGKGTKEKRNKYKKYCVKIK